MDDKGVGVAEGLAVGLAPVLVGPHVQKAFFPPTEIEKKKIFDRNFQKKK